MSDTPSTTWDLPLIFLEIGKSAIIEYVLKDENHLDDARIGIMFD